jgi:hypothetical protein
MDIDHLIKIMQASISPAVLISGFGLLLVSMTNRLGRTIDRVRQLNWQRPQVDVAKQDNVAQQMAILFRRGRILQFAITFNVWGIFAIILTILTRQFPAPWGAGYLLKRKSSRNQAVSRIQDSILIPRLLRRGGSLLFLISIWGLQVGWLVETSFLISLACLILSLLFFLYDITLSLNSLSLEIKQL